MAATMETLDDVLEAVARAARGMARHDDALADDLAQEGRIAAWQAWEGWEDRGVPRGRYALTRARHRMRDAGRAERRRVPPGAVEADELAELLPAEGNLEREVEERHDLPRRLAVLLPSERHVLELSLRGLPPDRVAAEARRSRRTTRRTTGRAVRLASEAA